ncbi:MAG TPA: patatin-like phospholipase family protein [Caulobacteraceae bacterium]|nr:patatin-like phospholipase family protein [Caulobacteraceae bacterium]
MTDLGKQDRAPAQAAQESGTAFESVALVLQGGGALGAYQGGVYQALDEHGIRPTWVAGISIGAINTAIIAGNAPERRVEKLRSFWETVSAGTATPAWVGGLWPSMYANYIRGLANQVAAEGALFNGVPEFFVPRFPPAPLQPKGTPGAISWYDTAPLRSTLERLADFDRINAREIRVSVGAVNVRTGNFVYFDNARETIGPEHIMASGALPPAFPPVEIGGEYYWDGGLVSNTPLDWVLSAPSELDSLILQVDLWSAVGNLPEDLATVGVRMKDIQFSSRTRAETDKFRKAQQMRAALNDLLVQLPPELAQSESAKLLAHETSSAVFNIVQLIYRSPIYEGQSKDYEFSRQTMEDHWRAGYDDARLTLAHPEVLRLPKKPSTVQVFDCLRPGGDKGQHTVVKKAEPRKGRSVTL